MQPARRQLPAVRVQGELPVASDALPAFDVRPRLAPAAEAHGLEPRHRDEAEPVVHLGQLHVRRLDVGTGPHLRGGVAARHRREVVELVPRRAPVERGPDRLHLDRRLAEVRGGIGAGDDHCRPAVARHVAVEQAQRRRDHPGVEVVVHRHRVAVDRVRVDARVLAGVERDLGQLLARRPELVEMPLGEHRDPGRRRRRREGQGPLHEAAGAEASAATAPAAGHDRRPALLALGAALVDAAEAQDVGGQSGRHGQARVDHRPELTGELDAARVPADFEAQRVLHFDEPRAGEAGGSVHGPGVGGDAVDLVGREARVLDGGHARVEREVERVAKQPAADLRLPHAADHRALLDRDGHQDTGSNSGM